MPRDLVITALATLSLPLIAAHAQSKDEAPTNKPDAAKAEPAKPETFKPEQQASKYGQDKIFKPEIDIKNWNSLHQPPGASQPLQSATNVMPDLDSAMKQNPNLKVLLNAGYFDLATPFFEGVYEMPHLPIPPKLQQNIEFQFNESGHMVYAHDASLKVLHDNVAAFIVKTENSK